MRLSGFRCILWFFVICLFFLFFQKSPLLAIGLLVILVGFKFAKTSINPITRVSRELHAINQHLAQLSSITETLDKVATQLITESEKESTTDPPLRTDAIPQEISEIDM